jgi:hypothetical protein
VRPLLSEVSELHRRLPALSSLPPRSDRIDPVFFPFSFQETIWSSGTLEEDEPINLAHREKIHPAHRARPYPFPQIVQAFFFLQRFCSVGNI